MSISVVIPAYNAAKYLAETLRSVLGQTFAPAEVIVVDDGSKDGTADIAEMFAPEVKVFRVRNGKQSTARNFGVNRATSEWIAFIDADDLWVPNKLELQMKELARDPTADLCYTGMMWMTQKGDIAVLDKEHTFIPADSIREALLRDVSFLPSTVVIRRSTFLRVGGFDPLIIYGNEDHDLWLRLRSENLVFAACPEPLMHYRRHPTNTSRGLPWFEECMTLFRRRVYPELPLLTRKFRFNSYLSDHEADLAYTLRTLGDERCLKYMVSSLLHRPFYEPLRYKVCAHMLYSRMRQARPVLL
jgi:glycosyltransferase involved in cell wall biosynthesis